MLLHPVVAELLYGLSRLLSVGPYVPIGVETAALGSYGRTQPRTDQHLAGARIGPRQRLLLLLQRPRGPGWSCLRKQNLRLARRSDHSCGFRCNSPREFFPRWPLGLFQKGPEASLVTLQ
jgi:hypothetical protein